VVGVLAGAIALLVVDYVREGIHRKSARTAGEEHASKGLSWRKTSPVSTGFCPLFLSLLTPCKRMISGRKA
jgi:hypothetical protein